jgi:hypothetical protein
MMRQCAATVKARCGVCYSHAEILKVGQRGGRFFRDQSFSAGAAFDELATDFHATPGVIA